MDSLDLHASLLGLALLAAGAACYGLRVLLAGSAHSARVRAQGGSALLGEGAMEFGYWCLQPVGRLCLRVGLTANQITTLSLVFGAAGGIAVARGHLGVGALFASVSALCDVLDGLVARATRRSNGTGAIFDASVDRYTEFLVLGGIAFYQRANALLLALALFALLGSFMISYGSAKAESMHVAVPRGMMRRAERAVYLCGGLLLAPVSAALAAERAIPAWAAAAPLVAVLALIAIASNGSAALRLRTIARAARSVPSGALVSIDSKSTSGARVAIDGKSSGAAAPAPVGNPVQSGVSAIPLRVSRSAAQR